VKHLPVRSVPAEFNVATPPPHTHTHSQTLLGGWMNMRNPG
jgi:hypothetical protein